MNWEMNNELEFFAELSLVLMQNRTVTSCRRRLGTCALEIDGGTEYVEDEKIVHDAKLLCNYRDDYSINSFVQGATTPCTSMC